MFKKVQVLRVGVLVLALMVCLNLEVLAVDPGAREDALAERQKVLRAADQMDGLVEEMGRLREALSDLKKRVGELEAQKGLLDQKLTQERAERLKEREVLIAEVSRIVGKKPARSSANVVHKHETTRSVAPQVSKTSAAGAITGANSTSGGTVPANLTATTPTQAASQNSGVEKGYEHVVEQGQTLWLIAKAYRAQGVKVSAEDIRKANNLKKSDSIRVGQKLFIPHK